MELGPPPELRKISYWSDKEIMGEANEVDTCKKIPYLPGAVAFNQPPVVFKELLDRDFTLRFVL